MADYRSTAEWSVDHNKLNEKYRAMRESEGIHLNTMGSLDLTGQQGAIELLQESMLAIRGNLIWAGAGVAISTVASVWGLWPIAA